jgi:hypothetical protein
VTGGDTPAAKSTQVAAADLAAARVLQFPIYTRALLGPHQRQNLPARLVCQNSQLRIHTDWRK